MVLERAAAVALLAVAGSAFSADWQPLRGMPGPPGAVVIDESSIVPVGEMVKFWTMTTSRAPRTMADGRPYTSLKTLSIVDCTRRQHSLREMVYYGDAGGEGEILQHRKYLPAEAPFQEIVPGSVAELMLEHACRPRVTVPSGKPM